MSDQIGVAVVGLGRVSGTHIESIRLNPDITRLAAVVDIDESLAKSTAEKFQTKFYTSLEAALYDSGIQAMVICLPHDLHTTTALQVMEAGRHVLVEKPMATNLADGEKMVARSREKGVVIMAGQSYRFISGFREAKQRMEEAIGNPFNLVYIVATGFNQLPSPPWWQDVEKTGGLAFTMLGSHSVDMTVWMYEGKKPVRVYSEARDINPKFEGMDEILITIAFDDGSIATNHLSLNTYPEKFDGYIVGPKGIMSFYHARSSSGLLGVFSCDLFINGDPVCSGEQHPHNFALQMREFAEAILQQREPLVRTGEVLTQLAILDAAKKSAAAHQPVSL